jgi:hypothetical protein
VDAKATVEKKVDVSMLIKSWVNFVRYEMGYLATKRLTGAVTTKNERVTSTVKIE